MSSWLLKGPTGGLSEQWSIPTDRLHRLVVLLRRLEHACLLILVLLRFTSARLRHQNRGATRHPLARIHLRGHTRVLIRHIAVAIIGKRDSLLLWKVPCVVLLGDVLIGVCTGVDLISRHPLSHSTPITSLNRRQMLRFDHMVLVIRSGV